jgi:hypothetical protein
MVPRDHPLWADFEKWVRTHIPRQDATMLTIYWECFMAGAAAALVSLIKAERDKLTAEAQRRPPPKDIGMVTTEGPDQPKFDPEID